MQEAVNAAAPQPAYRLYKRRFLGVAGILILNVVVGMSWPWFGPVANETSTQLRIPLSRVNVLSIVISFIYLPVAPFVPTLCARCGLRQCYLLATFLLVVSAWIRVAGTSRSISSQSRFALLLIAQLIFGVTQSFILVLAPKYSQTWFDADGRVTATMIMSVSDPVGAAFGQVVSPLAGRPRHSIIILAILSTAVAPFSLLIGGKPPTPPSFSEAQDSPPPMATVRALLGFLPQPGPPSANTVGGREPKATNEINRSPRQASVREDDNATAGAYMTRRERLDFFILFVLFGALVASIQAFSFLSSQLLQPYGYSPTTSGLLGAALLLSGIVAAGISAPLFDRVLTHHLGITARLTAPIISFAWFGLIWAIRPHNLGPLYALFVVIGVFSLMLLPVALELGCELTRNPDTSAAMLWWSANLLTGIFVEVSTALRAGPHAHPPLNMRRAIIFIAAFDVAVVGLAVFFRGRQVRREADEKMRMGPVQTMQSEGTHILPSASVHDGPEGASSKDKDEVLVVEVSEKPGEIETAGPSATS